ncbi:iron-siderophore ABC transporter substrate-binding protein [Scrofimicrobium sp. R131]|uniref:Iron-siderophore ABC transporter substrate-binding protein n=1 Tax=Scrofimicrobium appendicitidis TaxID=3079930 RepID=A0AAU7V8D5_9ACTO
MQRNKLMSVVAALAIGAVGLAGCSTGGTSAQSEPQSTPQSEPAAAPGRTIDTMFGPVELPNKYPDELKVVALGWSDADAALALGVKPVAVYDWMGFGDEAKGVGPWATELFGEETPTVLPNVDQTVDYEAIAALQPDLILNVRSSGDAEQYEKLSSIAPTVSGPEGTGPFAVDWLTQFSMIAEALGLSEQGTQVLDNAKQKIDDVRNEHPEFAGFTAVVGTKFGDAYGAYLPGDTRWDLLEQLGFILNPAVADLPAQGFFAPISAEQISALEANVAVLFPIGYTLEELESDPLIASLAVVQDGRAVILAEDSPEAKAFSAGSILSVPLAAEDLAPQLAEVVAQAQ